MSGSPEIGTPMKQSSRKTHLGQRRNCCQIGTQAEISGSRWLTKQHIQGIFELANARFRTRDPRFGGIELLPLLEHCHNGRLPLTKPKRGQFKQGFIDLNLFLDHF